MTKHYILLLLIFACFFAEAQNAPSVICTASGNIKNSQTDINWVIGETVTDLVVSGDISRLTSGFSQPTYLVTAIKTNWKAEVKLFPNPTKNILVLESANAQLRNMHYEMYDAFGKKMTEGIIQENVTNINCSQLSPAVYYLQLINASNQQVQTFKIIKQ